jgi:hypothetical protein
MEYREETIARLRAHLGREPTDAEIKATRDALWRRIYADMAMSAACFRDEVRG